MAKSSKNNKKKRNMLSVCFWILVLVLIAVVFFVKRNDIKKNLDETDFFGRVFGKTPSFVAENKNSGNQEKQSETIDIDLLGTNTEKEKYSEATGTEANRKSSDEIAKSEIQKNETDSNSSEKSSKTSKAETKPEPTEKSGTENKSESSGNAIAKSDASKDSKSNEANKSQSQQETKESAAVPKTTEVTLYFITIDSDGSVNRKSVKRSLAKSDSPLTDSINTLLQGPSLDEKSKNMMTLIPNGTKLLGASVKNGTATLNFSENFEFNTVGVEGYIAQLMQIVFTATEFPTVKNVQFLIEGEKRNYLGSEGQWIGTPLARTSF